MLARTALFTSLLLSCAVAACAGAAPPTADVAKMNQEIATLRRQAEDDRRVIKDLDTRVFVLEDKLATAEVQREKTPDATASLPGPADAPLPPRPRGNSDVDGQIVVVDMTPSEPAAGARVSPPIIPRSSARRAPVVPRPASGGSAPVYDDKGLPVLDSVNERLPVVPLPEPGAAPPPRAAATNEAMDAYKNALDALKRHDHAAAITGFRGFLDKYPTHDYADNAQYWLGETYYDQSDFKTALVEFRAVIKRYPDGNKAPDALLKVGFCYVKLGDLVAARDVLTQVISIYPRSSAAQIATKRLVELRAQGG